MSAIEIKSKIDDLKELKFPIEEAKAEAVTIRDELKQEMMHLETKELVEGLYIVRWTSVLSRRGSYHCFQKIMSDVYEACTKQVSSGRFTIPCLRAVQSIR